MRIERKKIKKKNNADKLQLLNKLMYFFSSNLTNFFKKISKNNVENIVNTILGSKFSALNNQNREFRFKLNIRIISKKQIIFFALSFENKTLRG